MSQDTFARVEKKYVISREQYEWIRQFLAEYTVEDEYGQSTIRNVYYDTPGEEMIRHSIQKPEFKEKVRVRGYGKIGRNDDVFVELKRKYRGIVYKRRVSMPLSEAERFLARRGGQEWKKNHTFSSRKENQSPMTGKGDRSQREEGSRSEAVRKVFLPQKERPSQEEGDFVHRQILRELEYTRDRYDLRPNMYIAYDRVALYGKEDRSLRLTFDQRIRNRRQGLTLDGEEPENLYFEQGEVVMEIKCGSAYPLWLCRMLGEQKIYPTSFSKYGAFYMKERNQQYDGKCD